MWRRAVTAALSLGAVGAGAGAVAVANTEDPVATLKVCAHLPPRLLRDSATAATIAFDYKWSLWGLEAGTPAWQSAKHDAHLRSANRLQELCFRNGGIYIKLGQHIAQLEYVVPEEYVTTMRESMLKRCPVSTYEEVCGVFAKDLGESPETVFAEVLLLHKSMMPEHTMGKKLLLSGDISSKELPGTVDDDTDHKEDKAAPRRGGHLWPRDVHHKVPVQYGDEMCNPHIQSCIPQGG